MILKENSEPSILRGNDRHMYADVSAHVCTQNVCMDVHTCA